MLCNSPLVFKGRIGRFAGETKIIGMVTANTATLIDLLGSGLAREQKEMAIGLLDIFVRERVEKVGVQAKLEIADRVDAQVEKTMGREAKHLTTKEDLHREIAGVREDMLVMENRLSAKIESTSRTTLYWIVGLFVAMMAGFVATLFTILQKLG